MNLTSSQDLVRFCLFLADRPMQITEIAAATGLAYNSVKRQLNRDGLVLRHHGYPTEFSLRDEKRGELRFPWIHTCGFGSWSTWLREIRPYLHVVAYLPENIRADERETKATELQELANSLLAVSRSLLDGTEDEIEWHSILET